MPRILNLLLCILASFFLGMGMTGCAELSKQTYHVGVSLGSRSHHHQQLLKEMEREADNANCIELDARITDGNTEQQLSDIRALAEADVDMLIICAGDPVAMAPVVEEIFDQGIPVLLVDNLLPQDCYTAFIGADFYDMGRTMGEYLVRAYGTKGNLVTVSHEVSRPNVTAGQAGLLNMLRDYPDIHLVAQIEVSDADAAAQRMSEVIESRERIDFIVAESNELAQGALKAMNRHGAENVPVIVADKEGYRSNALKALNVGTVSGVVESLTGGEHVIRLARKILEGSQFSRYNYSVINVIDAGNESLLNTLRADMEDEMKNSDEMNRLYDDLQESILKNRYINILAAVLIFALLLSVWMLVRYLGERKEKLEKLSVDKSRVEKERSSLKDQNREQSSTLEQGRRFVSSVSHDLRTPLALILDPMRQLQASKTLSPEDRRLVNLMVPNARMQYRLVRQLSDIIHYKDDENRLNLTNFDFARIIGYWIDQFRNQAVPKHLTFTAEFAEGDYRMNGDEDKIVRMIYDLLGYSFKFTPINGSVNFRAEVEGAGEKRILVVTISDTGIGIPKGVKRHFFNPYMSENETAGASSMGLLLAKMFTELHHGEISASDNPVGRGTVVKVRIPMSQPTMAGTGQESNIYLEEEHRLTLEMMESMSDITSIETPTMRHDVLVNVDSVISGEQSEDPRRPELLIVTDNHAMRSYLRQLLSDTYNIVEAANGHEGFQIAIRRMPALVITEGMMPVMNGWEFAAKLTDDRQTAHIPVIMLTAYSDNDRLQKAYESGVETYITKPFHGEVLKAAVRNLLENSRRENSSFNGSAASGSRQRKDFAKAEQTWTEKLHAYIQDHISDPDITVEELSREFKLGRVQFYRRCKLLTSMAPNELIRTIRLKRAFTLLSTTDMTISEVAYAVGFSSPSYFSRCYRDYFGQTPKERLNETK